jgi:hypothetical protein
MIRHITAALIATLVLAGFTGIGIASAQTLPATATASKPVTLAQATPQPAPKRPPLLVLHVGAMGSYDLGTSDLAFPGVYCTTTGDCGASGQYQYSEPIWHFDYGAQINLTRKWYLSYTHNYIDQNNGRVGVPSTACLAPGPCVAKGAAKNTFDIPYTYQKLNDDRVDDASLDYVMGPVTVAGGWHERVRMCCGNPVLSSDANQVAWHDVYLSEAGRVGPGSKYFGKLAGLTVQEQYIPHNTSPSFDASTDVTGAKVAIPSEADKTHIQFTPNITLPIGNPSTSTFALTGTYTNNFDYYLNSPIMYLYNQVDFGIIKKWPPDLTFSVIDTNSYQFHQGYPYIGPDTINRNKLIMTLDIALPFF